MSNRTKEFYIYPKDRHGNRTGHVICVILRDGMMFEGTALCSENEQFCKAVGRNIAFNRATEAYVDYLDYKFSQGDK